MAIDPPPPNPERSRLEALVAISRRRIRRAREKLAAAQEDERLAMEQLVRDEAALDLWLIKNPPDQPELI